jgi:hypothetical protein
MPKQLLGYLEPVELREVWTDEARDFTPWLADPENLKRLGDALNIDLELEGTEVPVGPYSADIVAMDTSSNQKVIIENQLERTNHDHLGKLITYASGLGAKTMIWVAKEITEEHRRAIDFLNENSSLNMRLYAIRVQVMKIGPSQPAPLFTVIASPNEYSETATTPTPRSETRAMYLAFWNGFKDYAQQQGTCLKLRKPTTDHWFSIAVGRSHFVISLTISGYYKRIGCEVYIDGPNAKSAFQKLRQQQGEIEKTSGPLEWMELPEAQACRVAMYRKDVDPLDKSIWPDLFQWLKEKAEQFHSAFSARIKALPIEDAMAAAAGEES